jgi:tetratricopeptide (TPR) repeat protein
VDSRPLKQALTAVTLLLLIATTSGLDAQPRSVSMTYALDMYERGDRTVLTGFNNPFSSYGFYLDLSNLGPKWAKAKGKTEYPRRLLVMATFALEAASRSPNPVPLLEWACDRMRPPYGPKDPLPAERLWHQGALGILEAKASYGAIQDHLYHLNTRFKDEPRALLARGWMKQAEWEAIPAELNAIRDRAEDALDAFPRDIRSEYLGTMPPMTLWPETGSRLRAGGAGPGRPAFSSGPPSGMAVPIVPRLAVERSASIWTRPDVTTEVGRRVIRAYEQALESPSVAAEARLRLGYLRLVSNKSDLALGHLYEVPGLTIDADMLYLDDLFIGWAHERAGRMEYAERSYRHALARVPSGRTAATWLAAALQAQGKLAEAQELIDASLMRTAGAPDPWPLFGQGDFKMWPKTIALLRSELWTASARSR